MTFIEHDDLGSSGDFDDSGYHYIPYSQRKPVSDDLRLLREELSLQIELHGKASSQALEAFENLFRTSCRLRRPLDGLRSYSPIESERFFANIIAGTDGHVYWNGPRTGFRRNDKFVGPPRRWWWEHVHTDGVRLSQYEDIFSDCGQKACINPEHQLSGRNLRRQFYTDDQMIGALQVAAMQLGHPPTMRQWKQSRRNPTTSIYCRRFGSWVDALTAAGVITSRRQHGYGQYARRKATVEVAIESLQEARRFLGHIPGWTEYRDKALYDHLNGLNLLTSQTSIRKCLGGGAWAECIRQAFGE